MQQKHLFEYAVIRIVPKVEREEFMNAGVILYCASQRFLRTLFTIDEERLKAFCEDINGKELLQNLNALERICKGDSSAGPIAKLDLAGRFRWLTATRSTVIQTSKTHPGLCVDPQQTLDRLYIQLVL